MNEKVIDLNLRAVVLTYPHRLQLNWEFRQGAGKVTPTAIEKYSKIINCCRRNEDNMNQHVDGEWLNKESLPDLSVPRRGKYCVPSQSSYHEVQFSNRQLLINNLKPKFPE